MTTILYRDADTVLTAWKKALHSLFEALQKSRGDALSKNHIKHLEAQPTKQIWMEKVSKALTDIQAGDIEKVL